MKLNLIEKALVNNPVRALLQRRYEAPLLQRLGGCRQGLRVLEIGCGRGVGTEIIFKDFGAREVHAFDLDPDMIFQAKARLADYAPEQLNSFMNLGRITLLFCGRLIGRFEREYAGFSID